MSDVYSAIDFIFSCLSTIFAFMMANWILAFIVLIGLLGLIIQLYLNARSK